MENSAQLDSEELLHLALKATQDNKTEDSIEYLKRAIAISPKFGKAYYLLGALHAELGMYDRAIEEMTQAIELEPTIDAAHFQLGLLYITSGQLENAVNTWKSLDALGENHPFWLFKEGMIALANDKFEECIRKLEHGIKINTINDALNNDMRRVIGKAQEALESAGDDQPSDGNTAPIPNAENTGKSTGKGNHILLSAYQSSEDEKKH
jgi:tetratricopeptide (TPR) repeat protein